jgi:hypothetical protein
MWRKNEGHEHRRSSTECDFGWDVVHAQANQSPSRHLYRSQPVEIMHQPIVQTRLMQPRNDDAAMVEAHRLIQQAIAEQEEGNKATNPKDAIGSKKVPIMSVVPWGVIGRLALALLEGAIKYGRHNYRVFGVRASVYVDATLRHVARFWEGEDLDPDSKVGLHHIDKAIASLTVLRDAMLQGKWSDDRPPRSADGWVDELNAQAAEMIETLGPAKQPYVHNPESDA